MAGSSSDAIASIDNTTPELGPAWYAVALSTDVRNDIVPVTVLGRPWVVLRLGGQLVAFADRCPHRLAPLSIGTGDGERLRCGYHGWEYDRFGICTRIPALGEGATMPPGAVLERPAGVQERYGLVWLAPEEPVTGLPDFWEWEDPSFDTSWNEPRLSSAGAGQICDNFLDAAHSPVVHTETFGVPSVGYRPPEPVKRDGWVASTSYQVIYRNHGDPLVATGAHPLEQSRSLYKEVHPATTVLVRLSSSMTGATTAILFSCLPEDTGRSRVFKMIARNDFHGDDERLAASLAYEDRVLDEDLAVLESLPSTALPIDLEAEVHTRVDSLGVAYRRILAELVGSTPRSSEGRSVHR